MSVHPAISTETYREKALRKFKQQPLVPVGAAATTVALVIAMTKMRKGQSHSFNNWLRVRIVAQGLTVAAVVAGSWAYGFSTPASQIETAAAQDKAIQERAAFEDRLRVAEEITRAESGSVSTAGVRTPPSTAPPTTESPPPSATSRSWKSWWWWNGSKNGTEKSS
ncbi:hypoxia induced protein conserved region-domain-containing protein [Lactarius psammicola]|nr:hypoxia induced protein conserved region-domain-containing protein [Lactarius psammicola]